MAPPDSLSIPILILVPIETWPDRMLTASGTERPYGLTVASPRIWNKVMQMKYTNDIL